MPLQRISDLTAGSPPYSGAALVEVSVPTGASPPYVSRSAQISDLPYLTSSIAASTYAPLASPALTGNPTAPTPAAADSDTSIATTAFVSAAITAAPNNPITLSGDIAGSGTAAIVATLPAVNANVGTFQGLTVNAKGLVTAAANQSYLTASGVSGMVAGQIPIAATATTVTSSGNLSGAITTSGSLATTLANNAVATAHITNANVTYAKIQNVAANRLLGNATGSAAAPAEIALPLAVTMGGTNAAALAVNNGGATWGLTATLLQTNGTAVVPISDAGGTQGTAGSGGTLYIFGLGAQGTVDLGRANGTFASPTAALLGNTIGQILFDSTYAGSWNAGPRGLIQCNATENWTSAANGTQFIITTTTTGTLTGVARLTVGPGLQVGAPTGGDKGAGTVNATTVYGAGTVLTSDASLKRDIGILPQCLPLVAAIEPKSYRWREPDDPDGVPPGWADRTRWGFIAQDVERVLADTGHGHDVASVVDVGEDGIRGLSLGDMNAVLWQAVRELSAKVAALEGKPA